MSKEKESMVFRKSPQTAGGDDVNRGDRQLPLLPLRDIIVFPHMVVPLFVGRQKSIAALEAAMDADQDIVLAAQRDAKTNEPAEDDIHRVGTVGTVVQLLRLPDGTVKVLVEGKYRAQITEYVENEHFFSVQTEAVEEGSATDSELEALVRSINSTFEAYVRLNKKIPPEMVMTVSSIEDPSRLADTIVSHLGITLEDRQTLLETFEVSKRLEKVLGHMRSEMEILEVEKRIRSRVKKQMEKTQKEYYLNEQMQAIQKELGDRDEFKNEVTELEDRAKAKALSKEAFARVTKEIKKLKMMSPMSAEATVVRSYIDWMLSVPWKKRSKVKHDISRAEGVLNEDHYGLDEVKERILEFLAVQKRVKKNKGPVLCLVGPPGVGKTSLGESIARATNRKFVRMALGGVRDEAEIRGHRRTYIGSMPGKIIQKLGKVGVRNPLFLLDEIDKMGQDHRGDPASGLLEVLDPEQNSTFNDHYLEVDFDLSEVMFICTSNSMNIPAPLLDRMEVIRIPGYTEDEKKNIAERFLLDKQKKNNGLKVGELTLSESAVLDLIRFYTKEAGVRGLEREIAKLCRKIVREISETNSTTTIGVDSEQLEHYLGVKKFRFGLAEEEDQVGQVTGLAVTSVGGELLSIEAVVVPGKGVTVKTGSLGDVMQESIQAAMTVVRSRAAALGIDPSFHEKKDLHIHMPEGATPKDGPSAGIGLCTALVSVLTGIPAKAEVAMTGEITLRGQVLPIGGLKEKLLAAHRGGIKTVLIPEENRRDLKDIPDNVLGDIDVRPVRWIDEVLEVALSRQPVPYVADDAAQAVAQDEEPANKERPSAH